MATYFHEITGKINWANNLFIADSFEDGPEYYKANIVLDLPNYDKFKESGVRTKVREDSEGNPQVLLKRPKEPRIGTDGNAFGGGIPVVLDSNGNPWNPDLRIGNGSEVKVTYITYDIPGRKNKGHRLEKIEVLNLVPYEDKVREEQEEPTTSETSTKTKTPKVPF